MTTLASDLDPSVLDPSGNRVADALAALRSGRAIVVVDDEQRENEGDLIIAAEFATADAVSFMVCHSTGILCAPMGADRLDELRLPQMVAENTDPHATAFTVSVDHWSTTTGVSAADRAATLRALASADALPGDFRRPGHVFPLRGRPGGVLERPGHTEAALDLMALAGLRPVAVIAEIVAEGGAMRSGTLLTEFARAHDLPLLRVADLIRHRRRTEQLVHVVGRSALPTRYGDFQAVAYRSEPDGTEHIALVRGDVAAAGRSARGAVVRVHSECLTGDAFGSLRCDCGGQLQASLRLISDEGCGVLVYLRGHEGRGIGLGQKLRAYGLQDLGADTVEANLRLGLPVDAREYVAGAQILRHLGVENVRLVSNNPAKLAGLQELGLRLTRRVGLRTEVGRHNRRYLEAKRDRLGHDLAV